MDDAISHSFQNPISHSLMRYLTRIKCLVVVDLVRYLSVLYFVSLFKS